jgi:hypothetical protein
MTGKSWGSQGWEWLKNQLEGERKLVRDGLLYPRYWDDPRFGIARKTAPVMGITWYEANAYCRWLAQERGLPEWGSLGRLDRGGGTLEIRLPTEAEWAEAAGGEAGGRFAWDVLKYPKEEIVRYANTKESGIGRTTPVWMYPQGASPRRVMDLSGNVWEWQANFYDKDHEMLGLRGGSWSYYWHFARVAGRNHARPSNGWSNCGLPPRCPPGLSFCFLYKPPQRSGGGLCFLRSAGAAGESACLQCQRNFFPHLRGGFMPAGGGERSSGGGCADLPQRPRRVGAHQRLRLAL